MNNQGSREMAVVTLDMKEILSAPLKKSPTAMVRVADQYLAIKQADQTKGLLRVIMYLEDMGASSSSGSAAPSTQKMTMASDQQPADY